MGRGWNRTDTNGVKDRKTRDIFIKIDEYLIDVSKQLTTLSGGAQGSTVSGALTEGATELGASMVAQPFVSINTDPTLINERVIAVDTSALTLTDDGAKGNVTVGIADPMVVTNLTADNITVNTALESYNNNYFGHLGSGVIVLGTNIQWDQTNTYAIGTTLVPTDHIYSNYLNGSCSEQAPALTFGTTNVAGTSGCYIPTNATLAIFDALTGADAASSASNGSQPFASRSDHAHRFPTSLMEYTNSRKLAISSTGTITTLTSDDGTVRLAGATTFAPSTNNAQTWGGAATRPLKINVGTSGINSTGAYVQTGTSANSFSGSVQFSGGVAGSLNPTLDASAECGNGSLRWLNVGACALFLAENSGAGAQNYNIYSTDSLSADRIIVLNFGDADRTITFSGDATMGDWFDQSVKVAASPTFATITVEGLTFSTIADGEYLKRSGSNIVSGTAGAIVSSGQSLTRTFAMMGA